MGQRTRDEEDVVIECIEIVADNLNERVSELRRFILELKAVRQQSTSKHYM